MNKYKDLLQGYNLEKYEISKAKHILDTEEDEATRINVCDYFPHRKFDLEYQLQKAPIQDVIDRFEWKDGKCEFSMYASKGLFLSHSLFGVVQSRRDELKALGYKVKEIEDRSWGTITRTWIVYELGYKHSSKYDVRDTCIFILGGLLFLALYLWFGFSK